MTNHKFCHNRIVHNDNGKELLKGRNVLQETYEKINNENTRRQLAENLISNGI